MTRDRAPGLIYRRLEPYDERNKRVIEGWDTQVPGCPLIRSPWSSAPRRRFYEWVRFVPIQLEVPELDGAFETEPAA